MTNYNPKLKLEDPKYLTSWNHRGGWGTVLKSLECLTIPEGTLCISALEEVANRGDTITEPWVGFIHHVPHSNLLHYHDLERLLRAENIINSLPYCKGIFVISQVVKQYLQNKCPNIPVAKLLYPLTPFPQDKTFKWTSFLNNRKIINIGTFLRNYQAIYDLQVPQNICKVLLKPTEVDFDDLYDLDRKKVTIKANKSVYLIDTRLSDAEYDEYLSSSIVFLNLYDATINTTVIECIGRNTPLVVNRLPGLEEYLGKDYPLFYNTLDEASTIVSDDSQLLQGSQYLQSLQIKSKLTQKHFLSSLTKSAIYRSLPLSNQHQHFQSYDLTIVVCSYKRVYNLRSLLECFKNQDFNGTFEIVLWNNNHETQQEVAAIADLYKEPLNIRLIQSTENYLCVIRLAVARLMRSDYLLVCDDDIVPQPNFITTFLSKYQKYGPDTALCCRGHVFNQHVLNEEDSEEYWKDPNDGILKKFFDEYQPDKQVHFMHASTSFYPKHLLLQASAYDLPTLDTILVDDYWLSFILSHKLKVPLWKIQGSHIFNHTPCADDENIALYKRPRVKEEQTSFYIYHMRQGWPASVPLPI